MPVRDQCPTPFSPSMASREDALASLTGRLRPLTACAAAWAESRAGKPAGRRGAFRAWRTLIKETIMSNVTVLPAPASSAAANPARPGDFAIEFKPTDAFRVSGTKSQAERRKRFSPIAMNELADSIKHAGVIQPILARLVPAADKKPLEIVLGERRWTAAIKAGLKIIPVVIRVLSDEEVTDFQLIENVHREKLHGLAEL